jgi:uncharacterized protein
MELLTVIILFTAGLFGGGLSAVAGGASFFTFPALLAMGLSPLAANATNFVALTSPNITALPAFRKELRQLGRDLILPLVVGGFGGLAGALILLALGGGFFAKAVPYLMAMATLLFATAPLLRAQMERRGSHVVGRGFGMSLLFVFAIYGGYFGAGLGQIMLAAMMLSGYTDFHTANAAKNAINATISVIAVSVYGFTGAVAWPEAGVMFVGAAIGGYVGGHMSLRVPQQSLRWAVIFFGGVLTVYYFVNGA